VAAVVALSRAAAGEPPPGWRVGVEYGRSTQQAFPLDARDYHQESNAWKLLLNWPLRQSGRLALELQVEPSLYLTRHQLMNPYFIKVRDYPDYLAARAAFAPERFLREYALNTGLVGRLSLTEQLSLYLLGGVGPMVIDRGTERLARGFAFSDIVAAGVGWRTGRWMLEARAALRHASNLELQFPNSGQNTIGFDVGLSWQP
jgi:hypothetical protein